MPHPSRTTRSRRLVRCCRGRRPDDSSTPTGEASGALAEPVHKAPLGWILTPLTAGAIAAALEPGNITPANQRALNQARLLF